MKKSTRVLVTRPLEPYAAGYRAELDRQGYSAWTAVSYLYSFVRVSRRLAAQGLTAADPDGECVDRFLTDRPGKAARRGEADDAARDVFAAGLSAACWGGACVEDSDAGRRRRRCRTGGAAGGVHRVPADRTRSGRDDDRLVSVRRRVVPVGAADIDAREAGALEVRQVNAFVLARPSAAAAAR